jgi:hypothetical protein
LIDIQPESNKGGEQLKCHSAAAQKEVPIVDDEVRVRELLSEPATDGASAWFAIHDGRAAIAAIRRQMAPSRICDRIALEQESRELSKLVGGREGPTIFLDSGGASGD